MSHRLSLSGSRNLRKLMPIVALPLFCAAIAVPLRAEDKLDKKAVELCKKVGNFYNNAKKREINVAAVYDIERPNRLSLKTQMDGDSKKGPDIISDGKKLTVYR